MFKAPTPERKIYCPKCDKYPTLPEGEKDDRLDGEELDECSKLPPLSESFTVQHVTNIPPCQKERKMTDLMVKSFMNVQSSHPWAKALLSKWQNVTNNPPCQKERKMTDLMVKNLMTGSKGRSRSLVAK